MKNEEKDRLRREFLARRQAMKEQEVQIKSRAIQTRVEALLREQGARTVMSYVSVRNEVRTQALIRSLLAEGIVVAVPLCVPERLELVPCRMENLEDDLEEGHFGIPEPKENKRQPLPLEELEAIIVPGVAFDRCGYRLGHGSGYYDLFLRRLPDGIAKIGLAYDWQVVAEVPRSDHDVPVDLVVTETEVIAVGPGVGA